MISCWGHDMTKDKSSIRAYRLQKCMEQMRGVLLDTFKDCTRVVFHTTKGAFMDMKHKLEFTLYQTDFI